MLHNLRHNVEKFFSGLWGTLKFLVLFVIERKQCGKYYFPYKINCDSKTVSILANGPSLSVELEDEIKGKSSDDFLVVNFFANTEYFERIKPIYYCLADPDFYVNNNVNDNISRMFDNLNKKVKWPITLFVWKKKYTIIKSKISNENIKIVGLSTLCYNGFSKFKYLYYKKGWAVPSYANVTIMAIYALLNLGYKNINLYGVDHSFLKNLCVNRENQLCIYENHFYGNEYRVFPPRPDGRIWHMKDYVYDKYLELV